MFDEAKHENIDPAQTKPASLGTIEVEKDETVTLAELLLRAELLCSRIDEAARDTVAKADYDELRLKLSQCRTQLTELQNAFNEGELELRNPTVRAQLRYLIIALMWATFYGRAVVDFRTFRMLVTIEATFSYLLICRGQ